MPTTIGLGNPQACCSAQTMASSGLVMQITNALGAYFLMPEPTCSITLRLMPSRSSRLMPGLRGTPAVTMQTEAPSIASYEFVPTNLMSKQHTGEDSTSSTPLPSGSPSAMTTNHTT